MPKINEHPCERCGHFASFSVRAIGFALCFYLCKDCMKKPDIAQWFAKVVKEKMEAKAK